MVLNETCTGVLMLGLLFAFVGFLFWHYRMTCPAVYERELERQSYRKQKQPVSANNLPRQVTTAPSYRTNLPSNNRSTYSSPARTSDYSSGGGHSYYGGSEGGSCSGGDGGGSGSCD